MIGLDRLVVGDLVSHDSPAIAMQSHAGLPGIADPVRMCL